jgi:glucose-1-phosphate thymidylyltransferase
MRALILGGGFSTRLYPLTEFYPKGLLQVGDKVVTQYVIDEIIKTGIHDIAIVSNNRYYKKFSEWVDKQYQKYQFQLVNNGVDVPEKRLGAIGDLVFALNVMKWNDDLLVVASDTLVSLNIQDYLDFFTTHQGVVIAVKSLPEDDIRNRLGCVELQGNTVIGFEEKPENPKSSYSSVPYYIFPKESIPLIKQYVLEGNPADAPGNIIPWFLGKIAVNAYIINDGYYYDIGTSETLENVRKIFNSASDAA